MKGDDLVPPRLRRTRYRPTGPLTMAQALVHGRAALLVWLTLAGAVAAASFAGTGRPPSDLVYRYEFAASGAVAYGLLATATVLVAHWSGDAQTLLGLRRPRTRWLVAALGVVVMTLIVSAALEPILRAGREQAIAPNHWHPDRLGQLTLSLLVLVGLGPLTEELFYRGLGIAAVLPFGPVAAVAVTALAWGLAHGIIAALAPLAVFGMLLAWLRLRAASVWPAVAAHATYNGIVVVAALVLSS